MEKKRIKKRPLFSKNWCPELDVEKEVLQVPEPRLDPVLEVTVSCFSPSSTLCNR